MELCLIFFLTSCGKEGSKNGIDIIWDNDRAMGFSIRNALLPKVSRDSLPDLLTVHLVAKDSTMGPAIFGSVQADATHTRFYPLVPFGPGQSYDVFLRQKKLGRMLIPIGSSTPEVVAIFPSQDTLPENILKFYFQFSMPMREGESTRHIFLINGKDDTIQGAFLGLESELWNQERTVLTLWLDPGRVKRDLQPNKLLGQPLERGNRYILKVENGWKAVSENALSRSFEKEFFVVDRDSAIPDVDHWKLNLPAAGTTKAMTIFFNENMDYFLSLQAITIESSKGERIPGKLALENEEAILRFTPERPWRTGEYRIRVESRLEDLASNNLNRLFDVDLSTNSAISTTEFQFKRFVISE